MNKYQKLVALMMVLATVGHVPPMKAQEVQNDDAPLRLEATIRGDKEQPRVLSIVPWQLPTHRNIEGTLSWKPQQATPTPLERTQFLRKMALSQQFSKQALTNQK